MYKPGAWALKLAIEWENQHKICTLVCPNTRRIQNNFCLFRRAMRRSLRRQPTPMNVFVVCTHRYRKLYRKKEPLKKLEIAATQKFKIVTFAFIKYRLHWIEPRKIVQLLLIYDVSQTSYAMREVNVYRQFILDITLEFRNLSYFRVLVSAIFWKLRGGPNAVTVYSSL